MFEGMDLLQDSPEDEGWPPQGDDNGDWDPDDLDGVPLPGEEDA
ncbi:hypothetical protein [Streptomyces misionensis]